MTAEAIVADFPELNVEHVEAALVSDDRRQGRRHGGQDEHPPGPAVEPGSALGNWYATALFWKPQVALFVNEATLLPVFVPLAPAGRLAERFPEELRSVLDAHGLDPRFVDQVVRAMCEGSFAKTASHSVVGVMNEFAFLGRVHRDQHGAEVDLIALSLFVSETPTSPLYQRHVSPDRGLHALVARTAG